MNINDPQTRAAILQTIANGHPYQTAYPCEGTVESGPYAHEVKGIRWGRFFIEIEPRGTISFFMRNAGPMEVDCSNFVVIPADDPLAADIRTLLG